MFCKAKSAKKQFIFCAAVLDHFQTKIFKCETFFPLLFPKDSKSKNIGHPTLGSGGTKTVKWYLKSEQTHRQTNKHTHMDISTYRKHQARGPMLWKTSQESQNAALRILHQLSMLSMCLRSLSHNGVLFTCVPCCAGANCRIWSAKHKLTLLSLLALQSLLYYCC